MTKETTSYNPSKEELKWLEEKEKKRQEERIKRMVAKREKNKARELAGESTSWTPTIKPYRRGRD
ncbi:hypothetical protein LQM11_005007 [Vibrio parahaemolyticus]|nr:hypothetical protein [Vibrio parahaemolyticus]